MREQCEPFCGNYEDCTRNQIYCIKYSEENIKLMDEKDIGGKL